MTTLIDYKMSKPENPIKRQKAKEITEEYKYELVVDKMVGFSKIASEFIPEIKRFFVYGIGGIITYMPYSGFYTVRNIEFYYSDEYKSGKCYLFFKTFKDLNDINTLFKQVNVLPNGEIPIYTYNIMYNNWTIEKSIKSLILS